MFALELGANIARICLMTFQTFEQRPRARLHCKHERAIKFATFSRSATHALPTRQRPQLYELRARAKNQRASVLIAPFNDAFVNRRRIPTFATCLRCDCNCADVVLK